MAQHSTWIAGTVSQRGAEHVGRCKSLERMHGEANDNV